ncbi:LysR family transcriptional regulator [Neptuniibacter pectenicola]|uniref:LysR family transcriptional regulator n=1 Tax=Neptuniibacter pectenicola TaxID=1806669 RepID=UPI0030EE10DA
MSFTLQQIQTLDALIKQGSIQAAARTLNKTHPSVIAVLNKLESTLNITLFDRSGYRLALTEEGAAFYKHSQRLLNEVASLEEQAEHLSKGEEAELNIVIGDLTPIPEAMQILREFAQQYPSTRLNFLFENLNGPNEQLFHGNADLIIHHIDQADPRYEYQPFCNVRVIPVASPHFFKIPLNEETKYTDLEGHTQCVIRDTSVIEEKQNYFIIKDSPQMTVGDQRTKKEIIIQSMAWGHMPLFLIADELQRGELISIQNQHMQGRIIDIVVARLNEEHKGIMADRLWNLFTATIGK